MHTTKTLTPEELTAEIAKITGVPAPEPEGFCPGCGMASNGQCSACREMQQESARLNRDFHS